MSWALWASILSLACGEAEPPLAPSPVPSDVARDGWVDAAEPVSGDGATEFVSGVPSSVDLLEPGSRFEPQDDDPLSPGVFDGGRIYGLSAYAGLVITDASAAGPSRVEGRYPLSAVPFDLSVRDGIVLVLVNDATVFPCFDNPLCQLGEGSRVLLIDARDPSSPIHTSSETSCT